MLNIIPNSIPVYQHVMKFWEAGRFYDFLINISNYIMLVLLNLGYIILCMYYIMCVLTGVYYVIGVTFI